MYDIQDICQIFHICIKMTGKKKWFCSVNIWYSSITELLEKAVLSIWSCNLISASCLLKWKVHLSRSLSRMRSEDKIWLKIFGKEQLIVTGKTNHCQYWVYQRCVSLSLQLQKPCHIAAVHPCKAPPAIMASV